MIFIILLLKLITFCSYCEEPVLLNTKIAQKMALENSEQFSLEKNAYKSASLNKKTVKSILFPQISAELFWIDNYKSPDCQKKNFLFDAGLNVNQIITTFGKITSKIEMMDHLKQSAKYQKKKVKRDVLFQTKLLYFQAYHAKKNLEIFQQSLNSAKKNQKILKKRGKIGRVSKYDTLKIKSDIACRVSNILNSKATYQTAIDSLRKQIGIAQTSKIIFKEKFSNNLKELSLKNYFDLLEKNHPLLISLKKIILAKKANVKNKITEYFPDISFFYKHNYKGTSEEYFIGNNALDRYGSYGINIKIPIFYGNKRYHDVQKAKLETKNSILQLKQAEKELILALETSIENYNQLLKIVSSNETAIKLAEESYEYSQKMFEVGKINSTDLNNSEMIILNQRLQKNASLLQLEIEKAKIERLIGIK